MSSVLLPLRAATANADAAHAQEAGPDEQKTLAQRHTMA